jgi:hypothetical protein
VLPTAFAAVAMPCLPACDPWVCHPAFAGLKLSFPPEPVNSQGRLLG